jgi:tetratricopeptide (TPR) repeat protein
MGLITKIFGKGKAEPVSGPKPPLNGPKTIQVFDDYGREFQMSRESYLRYALLPSFEKNKTDPEALYGSIVQGLRDGFAEEVLEPARTLAKIEPNDIRGESILGVILLQLKRFDEARIVLEAATARLGEQGWALTNLAKAYSGLQHAERARQILWHALELDPNQDNGLGWYAAMIKEREGEAGLLAAYTSVAELPGSWRAQLWLARAALARGDFETAILLYRDVLAKLVDVPTDALMQISGDLGNHGQLRSIIELCGPRFDASVHGLQVGNNLIKAYVDLKDPESARTILAQLTALNRPDWHKHLLYWDNEIDKSQGKFGPVATPPKLEVDILTLDDPIWARGVLGFESLLPATVQGAPRIVFFCASGNPGVKDGDPIMKQPTNELGRVTRALPMFLAEEIRLRCGVQTTFALPWISTGGFVLSAKPWAYRDLKAEKVRCDFVVMLHVDASTTPWRMRFSLLNGRDGSELKAWEEVLDVANSGPAILASVDNVIRSMSLNDRGKAPDDLAMPAANRLAQYLAASEQALAVGTANMGKEGANFLYGERSIVDSLLLLAVDTPTNVRTRCLLLNTLEKEARRRPDIVREYADKLRRLQIEHPLRAGAASTLVAAAMAILEAKIVSH